MPLSRFIIVIVALLLFTACETSKRLFKDGQQVTLEGEVTDEIFKHVGTFVPQKVEDYIRLKDGQLMVAYVKEKVWCPGKVRLKGKILEVRLEPEPGANLGEGGIFHRLDVTSWKCLEKFDVTTLINKMIAHDTGAEEKNKIERKILRSGKDAIPHLINHLGDKRIFEHLLGWWEGGECLNAPLEFFEKQEKQKAAKDLGRPKCGEPYEKEVTVGDKCRVLLYKIITPDYRSPYFKVAKSNPEFEVVDWKKWWEARKGWDLNKIHDEVRAAIDRFYQQKIPMTEFLR